MKSVLALALASLSTLAVASHGIVHQGRDSASSDTCSGWVQNAKGQASFTSAHNCATPSCGVSITSGFAAAVNELAFGANSSYGDACGRCFNITPTADPYELNYTGPFGQSIIVKVDNLCLDNDPKNTSASDPHWCGQTVSNPRNKFGMEMHFDLCDLTGAPQAFFPGNRLAMLGVFEEVPCECWNGVVGPELWKGSCLPDNPPLWPNTGCGNEGCPPQ